jgi:hypothetical protein
MSDLLGLSTHDTCETCGVEICARCHRHTEKYNHDYDGDVMVGEDLLACIQAPACECEEGPAVPLDLE